uniref:Uncharacterized protein n=1 Tax=Anguilla anguilla TaxID=7936 RepID=A0A0E9RAK6_ANGAN
MQKLNLFERLNRPSFLVTGL